MQQHQYCSSNINGIYLFMLHCCSMVTKRLWKCGEEFESKASHKQTQGDSKGKGTARSIRAIFNVLNENGQEMQKRQWCSGILQASHARAPGSPPGFVFRRNTNLKMMIVLTERKHKQKQGDKARRCKGDARTREMQGQQGQYLMCMSTTRKRRRNSASNTAVTRRVLFIYVGLLLHSDQTFWNMEM